MLIECHECGVNVSTEAATCMSCGAPPRTTAVHSPAFIKKQRQKLLDLRDDLVDSMSGLTRDTIRNAPEGSEASGSSQHNGDAGSDVYDRDFALSVLAKEQDALHEIEQALRRIEAGTYGICEISSNKIHQDRLEAIPFARLTVECQTKWEEEYGKRTPQNFQQADPPLPSTKTPTPVLQQSQHQAPHRNSNVRGIVIPSTLPPLSPPLSERSSTAAPELWNPNAAANWSLMFTPIFGAWIHAKNWNELGQHERGNKSMLWVYIGFAILVTVLFLPDVGGRLVSIAFLISWYFLSAKSQVKYLKENSINYEKKSWGKAVLLGFASLIIFLLIVIGLSLATDSSSLTKELPDPPESLMAE